MSTFYIAILTGLAWMGLTADFGWGVFAVGAGLGLVLMRIAGVRSRRPFGPVRALRLAWQGLQLFAVFLWELVVANLEQLRVILAPRIAVTPGWIRIRSDLETPAARALLGVMISLTPGSLTYEEGPTEDGSWILSLHVLDLRDEEQLVAQIRSRFESRLRAMERL